MLLNERLLLTQDGSAEPKFCVSRQRTGEPPSQSRTRGSGYKARFGYVKNRYPSLAKKRRTFNFFDHQR